MLSLYKMKSTELGMKSEIRFSDKSPKAKSLISSQSAPANSKKNYSLVGETETRKHVFQPGGSAILQLLYHKALDDHLNGRIYTLSSVQEQGEGTKRCTCIMSHYAVRKSLRSYEVLWRL